VHTYYTDPSEDPYIEDKQGAISIERQIVATLRNLSEDAHATWASAEDLTDAFRIFQPTIDMFGKNIRSIEGDRRRRREDTVAIELQGRR